MASVAFARDFHRADGSAEGASVRKSRRLFLRAKPAE